MSHDSRDSPSESPSLQEPPPSSIDSPSVLERLFQPFRPSFKRRYTANQLSTIHKNSNTASTSSLASSSKSRARSRRSNSSPSRPPSARSAAASRRSAGASSPSPGLPLPASATSAPSTSAGPINTSGGLNNNPSAGAPAHLSPSPRSSVDESVNSRYSPSGSFSYDQSIGSDGGSRTTRQGPSPLASPHHTHPNIARGSSSPNLLSPPNDNTSSSSSRPGMGRRQSSSRRLATALARPFFRRSSSQKNDIVKAATAASSSARVTPLTQSVASISPAATESSGSSGGGYVSHQRPTTASTASGPPSPAAGRPHSSLGTASGRRQFTVSSTTNRSASSSHAGTATTPLAAVDTSHHAYPSPFFAQSTPTTNISNPFAPPIDCIPILTAALSEPITSTLAQLVPLSLIYPYAPIHSLCAPHALGSLPSVSSVSIASSSISEAPTTSSSYHPSSSSFTSSPASSSSALVANEQLAASSLSIPTTALATVWRQAKASEWVAQHGQALNALIQSRTNPMTPRAVSAVSTPQGGPLGGSHHSGSPLATAGLTADGEQDSLPQVFDYSATLQSVLDCLAPTAGEKGVDVVYFHGSRHQYYPKSRSPSSGGSGGHDDNQEVQEAFVRADEKGLGVALLIMLRQIVGDLPTGSTLEVGLSVALTLPNSKQAGKQKEQDLSNLEPDSDDDEEEEAKLGTYMLTVELTTSKPLQYQSTSTQSSGIASDPEASTSGGTTPAPGSSIKIDPLICSALFQYLHLSFMTLPDRQDRQDYKITCVLPQARPPSRGNPNFDPPSRRRKSIEHSRQPSVSSRAQTYTRLA